MPILWEKTKKTKNHLLEPSRPGDPLHPFVEPVPQAQILQHRWELRAGKEPRREPSLEVELCEPASGKRSEAGGKGLWVRYKWRYHRKTSDFEQPWDSHHFFDFSTVFV